MSNAAAVPGARDDAGARAGAQHRADRMMFFVLLASASAALAIGWRHDGLAHAAALLALPLALGAGAWLLARGKPLARYVLAGCNAALVMLHVQLAPGSTEFQCGAFVLLALLLGYRDARLLVLTAALLVLHGIVLAPEPAQVALHASYLMLHTGALLALARSMRERAREGIELRRIVRAIDAGGAPSLDMSRIVVGSATATALKTALANLHATIGTVRRAVASLETTSVAIASGNQSLSERTELASCHLQQAAFAMEQLTATVLHSADAARTANELACGAAEVAARGGAVVSQVVATMDEINTSSRQIADITGVIDGIAFQTNILALNAAVEAARAGEQGRGFAVVAAEVRGLAQRSAEAAKQIKALIAGSVDKVDAGAVLVRNAGTTMGEIVASVGRVAGIIGQISAAAPQQRDGIGEVNSAVAQLGRMAQQNSALVGESAAAAEALRDQALQLAQAVGALRVGAAEAG